MPIVHSPHQRATLRYDPLRFAIFKWKKDERAKDIKSKDLPNYRYEVKLCNKCKSPLTFAVRKDQNNKSRHTNLVGWCLRCGVPDFIPNCHARSKRKIVDEILKQGQVRVHIPLVEPSRGIEVQKRNITRNLSDGQPVVRVLVRRYASSCPSTSLSS